jgi:uncharacterized protein
MIVVAEFLPGGKFARIEGPVGFILRCQQIPGSSASDHVRARKLVPVCLLNVYTIVCYIRRMERSFEWNNAKAARNFRKHGIQFEEAVLVFDDLLAVSEQDRVENGEARWKTIGMVGGVLLLLVAHTLRSDDTGSEIIRIISARRVDKKERYRYEHG